VFHRMALRSLICGIRKLTFLFPLLHVRLGCIFGREFPKAIDGESVADPTRIAPLRLEVLLTLPSG